MEQDKAKNLDPERNSASLCGVRGAPTYVLRMRYDRTPGFELNQWHLFVNGCCNVESAHVGGRRLVIGRQCTYLVSDVRTTDAFFHIQGRCDEKFFRLGMSYGTSGIPAFILTNNRRTQRTCHICTRSRCICMFAYPTVEADVFAHGCLLLTPHRHIPSFHPHG